MKTVLRVVIMDYEILIPNIRGVSVMDKIVWCYPYGILSVEFGGEGIHFSGPD